MLGAWMTAALTRAKKMPTLDKLLGRQAHKAPPTRQEPDEMLAAMRQWAAVQNAAVAAGGLSRPQADASSIPAAPGGLSRPQADAADQNAAVSAGTDDEGVTDVQ